MNAKVCFVLRLIRNILIAVASAACVLPFIGLIGALLDFMKLQEHELVKADWPQGAPFSYVDLAEWFLMIAATTMTILVAFWAFVAANKLWPIRKKPKAEQKE